MGRFLQDKTDPILDSPIWILELARWLLEQSRECDDGLVAIAARPGPDALLEAAYQEERTLALELYIPPEVRTTLGPLVGHLFETVKDVDPKDLSDGLEWVEVRSQIESVRVTIERLAASSQKTGDWPLSTVSRLDSC